MRSINLCRGFSKRINLLIYPANIKINAALNIENESSKAITDITGTELAFIQMKKIPIFMILKNEDMPTILYKSRFIIVIIGAALLLLSSCKKSIASVDRSLAEQYFETNILNNDFTVQLATLNGADLTPQYTYDTFRLFKNSLLDGPMTGKKNGVTYNGSWSCNDDYSKLTINLPSAPSEFVFLTREWKFTKKALPIMELAPWIATDSIVLHMEKH